MSDEQPFRRRIDRVTADDALDGMADWPVAEVRRLRDDCREEEARLSYARRLLHAKLDIARSELGRRDGTHDQSLVEALERILADEPVSDAPRSVGNAGMYNPDEDHGRRVGDRVLDSVPLGLLPDLSDDELTAAVTAMAQEERTISDLRRRVLDSLDRLQAELIGRYRDGGATVDELVPRPSA
jgi:hypothetical protein